MGGGGKVTGDKYPGTEQQKLPFHNLYPFIPLQPMSDRLNKREPISTSLMPRTPIKRPVTNREREKERKKKFPRGE